MMTDESPADRSRRLVRRRRVASFLLAVLVGVAVVAVVAFIFILEMEVPISEVPREGILTGWSQVQAMYGPRGIRMSVQLEDGRVVEVRAGGRTSVSVGSRVLVYEQTTRLLGRTTYRHGRTLHEAPPVLN
jgi:hypothetical protein